MLNVHDDAARPCRCCMLSMLHVHVDAASTCPCCMPMFVLHVHVLGACHAHVACPCPCCMSMLHVHIRASCPIVHVLATCPRLCCISLSELHVYVNAAIHVFYCMSMLCQKSAKNLLRDSQKRKPHYIISMRDLRQESRYTIFLVSIAKILRKFGSESYSCFLRKY
jgi:hypothetical protein